jgi:hypothetical protein
MKRLIPFIFLIFSFPLLLSAGGTLATNTDSSNRIITVRMFTDVPKSHWAYDAILELIQNGIVIGYADSPANKFRGERTLTRYEFAYALAKAVIRIEENIRKDQKNTEIQDYLKSKNVSPKDVELMSMLMQEFKTELNALDIRTTRLEEFRKSSGPGNLPLYLSIGAVIVSVAALAVAIQK